MHRNKQIAIILPDTLQSIGLQSMLTDYFPPVEISHYPTFEAFSTSGNDTFDYYFTNAALFVLYADFFLPRRSKTMVLIDGTEGEGGLSATSHITIKASQEVIIEQLEQLFTGETNSISIVPVSFSRTMDMEVIMAQINIRISPITPGTKL